MERTQSIFSVGVIGGAPFTDVVNATTSPNLTFVPTSSNFAVGPSLQVDLPLSLRAEVDALYRPYSFTATESNPNNSVIDNVSGTQWSFPILAQYRFKTSVLKPFVEGGLSFDRLSSLSTR